MTLQFLNYHLGQKILFKALSSYLFLSKKDVNSLKLLLTLINANINLIDIL
jgi:hypothetical protein